MKNVGHIAQDGLQFPARLEVIDRDRRAGPRVYHLFTHDIGSGAVSFKTDIGIPEGTLVKVQIYYSLPPSRRAPDAGFMIQAEGMVVQSEAGGMAVALKRNYKIVSRTAD